MLRRLSAVIVLALCLLAPPALAQVPFTRVSSTVTLAVTGTSSNVAIGTSTRITALWTCNTGAATAYVFFGDSNVVATTLGTVIPAGLCANLSPDGKTFVAAITAGASTTLEMTPGSGINFAAGGGSGGGGGGGGAVTVADGADVTQGAKADAACGTDTGTCTEIALIKRQLQTLTSTLAAVQAAIPAGTNNIGNVGQISQYPNGAVPITISATGTTTATTATLAASASIKTYICGFSIRANATAAATNNSTITGTVTGTLNFTQWTAPLASGIGLTEQIFSPCIPSSAINTGIAVISGAPGSGGVVSVSAWGYQL